MATTYTATTAAESEQALAVRMIERLTAPGDEFAIHHSDPVNGQVTLTLEIQP